MVAFGGGFVLAALSFLFLVAVGAGSLLKIVVFFFLLVAFLSMSLSFVSLIRSSSQCFSFFPPSLSWWCLSGGGCFFNGHSKNQRLKALHWKHFKTQF